VGPPIGEICRKINSRFTDSGARLELVPRLNRMRMLLMPAFHMDATERPKSWLNLCLASQLCCGDMQPSQIAISGSRFSVALRSMGAVKIPTALAASMPTKTGVLTPRQAIFDAPSPIPPCSTSHLRRFECNT
jgi:hypothetical protein